MTEAQWLTSVNAWEMLFFLEKLAPTFDYDELGFFCVRTRKVRLFGCACARKSWHLVNNWEAKSAVEVTEKVVDGLLPVDRLEEVRGAVGQYMGWWRTPFGSDYRSSAQRARDEDPTLWPERLCCRVAAKESLIWDALSDAVHTRRDEPEIRALHIAILRDIFGNPFRSFAIKPSWLAWNNGTVVELAKAAYVGRTFDQMPILGDALEEAGCLDQDILTHCREPAEHVRGCWVVDLLLRKT